MSDKKYDNSKSTHTNYNRDIDEAKAARNNQLRDTDPMYEKVGYLGMDDINKMRRRNIR